MLALKTQARVQWPTRRLFSHMAYRVHRGAVTTPTNPVHPEQRVESTWTIYNPERPSRRFQDTLSRPRMEKLKICTPGLTLIRVRPELRASLGDDVVAQVRVSSNAAEVLNSVRIAPKYPFRTIVEFRPPAQRGDLTGNLLTEIDLPHGGALKNLAAIGYGDVVVDPQALVNEHGSKYQEDFRDRFRGRRRCGRGRDEVALLLAAGDGRLFLNAGEADLNLKVLKLAAVGRSQLYANLKGLEVSRSMELGVVGGEDARLHVTADAVMTPRLKLSAIGSGAIDLTVRRHLEATDIKTLAVGAADVQVNSPDVGSERPSPLSFRQKIFTLGTNSIDLGSIQTQHSQVGAFGWSDVRVRTRDSLRFLNLGDTIVECVGAVPPIHRIRGFRSPTVMETPVNDPQRKPTTMQSVPPPAPSAEDAFKQASRLSGLGWW